MPPPHSPEFQRRLKEARSRIQEVSTAQAAALLEAGALVLDVRGGREDPLSAIPGALRVSAAALPLQAAGILPDRNRPVLVVCADGERSALAAHDLRLLGYRRVVSLAGGLAPRPETLSLLLSSEPGAQARSAREARACAVPLRTRIEAPRAIST